LCVGGSKGSDDFFPAKMLQNEHWEVVKGKTVSTEDLPFWQNRQKLAIKKGGKKGKAVTIGIRSFSGRTFQPTKTISPFFIFFVVCRLCTSKR
jgi:hypothetical protein